MHVLDLRGFPSEDVESDALEKIGLRLYRPPLAPVIGRVVAGGAADRAGLRADDRIAQADGGTIATLGPAGAGDTRAARQRYCG